MNLHGQYKPTSHKFVYFIFILVLLHKSITNKNIIMSYFKCSDIIQKKGGGPDRAYGYLFRNQRAGKSAVGRRITPEIQAATEFNACRSYLQL